jgi:endonuclease III
VISRLREFYGLQPTPPSDLFQFLIWEILSEHALPARRDLAWQALRRLPALTPDAMFRAPAKELASAVGFAGPNRDDKLERMRAVVGEFRRHRDALDAETLARLSAHRVGRALRQLEHVARDTRARAVLFAADHPVLPLDDDVTRVVNRLMGMPGNRRRSRARSWLGARVERRPSVYREAIVYLRHHAQHTCLKVGPHCGICPIRSDCAWAAASVPPVSQLAPPSD